MTQNKKRQMISSFTILFGILIVLAIITLFIPDVNSATLPDVVNAPVLGFLDAISVCVFVLVLGGFLGIVTKTGALENGIATLVRGLKGKELILIPVLMTVFSIGGTTYGMLEETVPFYALLAATMFAAGLDPLVGASVVLLGAGSGVLGSTINPFAVGAAQDALLGEGITVNSGIVMLLGTILWLSSLLISIFFVLRYAKKLKADKGSTILSLQEQENAEKSYGDSIDVAKAKLTGKQKLVLILFAFTFIVMIISFIPWPDFGITFFESWTAWLTGIPFGEWYFDEVTAWFLIMSIVIGLVGGLGENKLVNTFVAGAADMISVVLIIALARGISVLMDTTGLNTYILENAANGLSGMPAGLFAPLSYGLYLVLSFLIPSSSGLATMSMPIMGPLASALGFSVETTMMIFVAGNGLVNMISPTTGAIMGGLAIAHVEYSTWVKFAAKVIGTIIVVNVVILTAAMLIL